MALSASQVYLGPLNSEYKSKYNYFNHITFKLLYCGSDDKEYQNFLKVRNTYSRIWLNKCKVEDMSGSIFSAAPDYSLAISVSADFKMNSGIAGKFKEKYSYIEIFKEQNAETGGLAFVKDRDTERFIYYLVVMPVYYACPTYYTVWMALQKLKENVLKYQIKKIAMSHIGCGIAVGVSWDFVKSMIEYTFRDVSIEIIAYEGKSPCILNHDIEDCYCYGYSLLPPEHNNTNAENFNLNQGAMFSKNKYYNYSKHEDKNKYCDQTRTEDFSEYSNLLGRGNFWENNSQTRDCYKYGVQGEHNTYNTFNNQSDTISSTIVEANNHDTQKEEDVYHKYCIRVGNDYYVKYSTEDAANDYYGALY